MIPDWHGLIKKHLELRLFPVWFRGDFCLALLLI